MKNSRRGSVSLLALLFTSFLLSLGGTGAAAAYFQKNPDDFMSQLHAYFSSRVNAEELAPLDATPTPTDTITPAITPTPTDTITPTPTPSVTPSITGIHGDNEDEHESEEELHESIKAKIHENEHGENVKVKIRVQYRGSSGLSFVYRLRDWLLQNSAD